ncbi:MAG: bifunctional riboflavin kinase/FAD synthetase [Aestuariivita sp.]|nr:bifunctional riboflavin kinase/FAD synthetase [Aestuariivita sp.]
MRIIRDYQYIEQHDRGAIAAIGNFDGVHLGHQSIIDVAQKLKISAPLGVLTFEPHPREYFSPGAPAFRLMSATARASRLAKLGVKRLYELNFNKSLASLTPSEFATKVIHQGLGLSHVVIGSDFCFGKARAGTAEDLKKLGVELGFGVTISELIKSNGSAVSSTAIRKALSEGRPHDAAEMLGHWHRIEGPVIRGEQRGRQLGFPTANMSINGIHRPGFGVYAVLVDVLNGSHKGNYQGVASVGIRPMFGNNQPNIETFLFDFSGDLYGATMSVGLIAFLRPEKKFDDIDHLIIQMNDDCKESHKILNLI